MENWCELVSTYPRNPEPNHLAKALRTVGSIIDTDLAPFEIEWLLETFLFKPVHAINTVILKRLSEDWHKNLADIFKIISKVASKYWTYIDQNEKILQMCLLPFDPQTRKEAVYCLINILKNPGADVGDAVELVNALERDTTCRTPLVLLVGSLCRYYPESVEQKYDTIWRIYLNMLQSHNRTDTLVSAVLQGIDGLLENFGRDISIRELQNFYKDLFRKCADINKCIEPLLSILKSHASLFREMLVEDRALRLYVWGINSPNTKDALLSIYTVIFAEVPPERIEVIIRSEIQPKMNEEASIFKHTALRILINAKIYHNIHTVDIPRPDQLEFQMRHRPISYDEADLVSLCLESREIYVRSLLMTAIIYYHHLPAALRQSIVVKGIRDASKDIRKMAITLLIDLSRQDGGLEKYTDVWKDILDTEHRGDEVLTDTLLHVQTILRSYTNGAGKDFDLPSLSNVLCFVLSVSETDDYCQYCDLLKPYIVELANRLCVCPSEILSAKYQCMEMFKQKSILKELLSNFQKDKDIDTLSVIQVLLGQDKLEAKLYTKALSEFDILLKTRNDLDQRQVGDIIKQVTKLRTKDIESTCDGRVLQRDSTVFIGEHAKLIETEDFTNALYSLQLRNKITLKIPNINEGISYKIDLLRILQICLQWEDFETLYSLLVIVSANLRDRPDPALQTIAWKCIHALFRTNGSVDVTSALRMCVTAKCVQETLLSIKEERNPEVRRKLCDSLQVMLFHDPGSESAGQLLTLVAEEMLLMINSPNGPLYGNGIDIAKVFLSSLHNDDSLTIQYLPRILIATSRRIVKDFYKNATDIFIEKLDIFEECTIKETMSSIVHNMFENNNRIQLEMILEFLKRILEAKFLDSDYIFKEIINVLDVSDDVPSLSNIETFSNFLQIITISKSMYNIDEKASKSALSRNNLVIIKRIANILNGDFNIHITQNILKFLNEYAVELLDIKKVEIIECLSTLIENIRPELVVVIKTDLSVCLCTYKTILQVLPNRIIRGVKKLCEKINIKQITDSFYDPCNIFAISDTLNKFADSIHSLSIISKIFDYRISETAAWTSLLIDNKIKLRTSIVMDMLSVSEKCLSLSEFGNILKENPAFVQKYLNVYFEKYLLSTSIVSDINYFPIFVDAVKVFADNYKEYDQYWIEIVQLFDMIWLNFGSSMGYEKQLSIASDLFRLPNAPMIPTLVNWVESIITDETSTLHHKIQLICILPGGKEYSSCYRHMGGLLPIHFSEMGSEHAAVLRCLLDALASSGDLTLLDIIITKAAADDASGWWDDAIDACMASLADRRDQKIFNAAFKIFDKKNNWGSCRRVFLPLLKHSTRTFCEEYISGIIKDVLNVFKTGFKEPSNSEIYRERILSYTKAFSILQVVIEKLPAKNLESGIINMGAGYLNPWGIVKDLCIYSVTLRDKVLCPDDARQPIKDACLILQCVAYNCLVSAICKRRPVQKQYAAVFNVPVWSKVVDPDVQYVFPPRAFSGESRNKRSTDTSTAVTSTSFTATVRTRMFMATLSENPLQYDMIPNPEDEEDEEEDTPEPRQNHPLNSLGVLSSITDLLVHASTLQHAEWVATVVSGLSNLHKNAQWTLAQAICNAEGHLKPHASTLAPALLGLVVATPNIINDRRVLNNIHIEILWTIMRWDTELSNNDDLNACLEYLISSCVEYRSRDAVSRRLLGTLNNYLQLYKDKVCVKWSFLETYCNDLPANASYVLPILQRILKNGVGLPDLLTIYNKFNARQWTSKLAEVFGLAVSLERNKEYYLSEFCLLLDKVKMISVNAFVKILLYVQRVCWQCCDLRYIRIISDLAPKVEKSKCLTVISVYLENLVEDDGFCLEMFHNIGLKELLDGDHVVEAMKVVHAGLRFMNETMRSEMLETIRDNCCNSSAKIRKQAFSVILKVFQDLVAIKEEHQAKRRAMDSTPILDTMGSDPHRGIVEVISYGLFDDDEEISKMMRDGVQETLSKEMVVRFTELFYIIFYFAKSDYHQLSDYGYVFLDLLFRDLKQQEGFKSRKLSDQPLPSCVDVSTAVQVTVPPRSIDVELPVADIFEAFLQSAKKNSQICQELLIELMKRFQDASRRFDYNVVIAKLLVDILKKPPNSLTPLYVEASRIFLNNLASVDGFKQSLNVLKQKVCGSDSAAYIDILYEDLLLNTEGMSLFQFGTKEQFDVHMRKESERFSIEGLTGAFGKLANWDDLKIQEKNHIQEYLPRLFADEAQFKSTLENYFEESPNMDYSLWFNKMAGAYCSNKLDKPILQYKEYWLKDCERWPTRDFVTSAVIEAIKWSPSDVEVMSCDIKSSDCLVEWSARLMIRSSYFCDDARQSAICRVGELQWCSEANRRGLPKLALQCIERNKSLLREDEALSWFQEKVIAHRSIALRVNDTSMLQKALRATEQQSAATDVCLQKLILQLRNDLGILTTSKLEEMLESINNSVHVENGTLASKNNFDTLKCIYDLAMNYYNELWDTNDICTKSDIISKMADIVQTKLAHNLFNDHNLLVSILLNKLMYFEGTLDHDTAKKVLDVISSTLSNLDSYSIAVLSSITSIFPESLRSQYRDAGRDESLFECKRYLQLVNDPQYAVLTYCHKLFHSKDGQSYKIIFNEMKRRIFSNKFSGTDYRSLNTIKNKLFGIENVDNIVTRHRVLKSIEEELKKKPQRTVLRLSQLSPELLKPSVLEIQKTNLQTLLTLPPTIYVVKFLEKIEVFIDSIRRPCVISALLSNGVTKRYIIKTGEPLSTDASVQRSIAILPKLYEGLVRSYNVTSLAEDAAIIEYLEDHERLRVLMGDAVDVPLNQRLADDNLVSSPALALEQYLGLCKNVPVQTLRLAIEQRCASVQEFISKKQTYLATLCSMTMTNWLFGVGDRHLHNIMMDKRDGGVCGVDWATTFQYGLRERVPARLTPCVLAVCDTTVLESRLQSMLLSLRRNRKLYEAYIKISFYWKGQDFKEMTYINNILEGAMLSYQVTKKVLEESNAKQKEEYIAVLNKVFEDFTDKHIYSVEEQISCLLKHCTDIKLLSITPQGWEGWL